MMLIARCLLVATALACVCAAAEDGGVEDSSPVVSDGGQVENGATRGTMNEELGGNSQQDDRLETEQTHEGLGESNHEGTEQETPTPEEDGFDVMREMFQRSNSKTPSVGLQPPPEQPEQGEKEGEGTREKLPERPVVGFVPELPPSIIQPGYLHNGTWYIMFYAAWCQHSQAAMPQFLEMIQRVVDQNSTTIYIGKSEVTKNSAVAKHFEIKLTPTFIMIRNGHRYRFEEEVTTDNLFNFMTRVVRGGISKVTSMEQLATFRAANPILFLLAHDVDVDKDWQSTYVRIATDKIAKGRFAYSLDPGIVEEFNPPSLPVLMVFKGEKVYFCREPLSTYALSRWITLERFEDFAVVNTSTLRHYLKPATGRRLAILVVSEDTASRRIAQKKAVEVVKKLALGRQEHKNYQFLLLEGTELIENLLRTSYVQLPLLVVYEPYRTHYYLYDTNTPMTEKAIREFLKGISTGAIDPLGGPAYKHTVIYYFKIVLAVIKTMMTHQPVLSGVTGVCLVAVSIFYLAICCCRSSNKKKVTITKASRSRAKKAALARKNTDKQNGVRRRKGKDSSGSNSEHSDTGEPEQDKDK